MTATLVDVRALQDPATAASIGAFGRSLLRDAPDIELVGLADPALPPLPDGVLGRLRSVRTNAYTGAMTGACRLLSLSPMTQDPLFVARLLLHPAVPCAAVTHGAGPGTGIEHAIGLRWLARYDRVLSATGVTAGAIWAAVRALVPDGPPSRVAGRPVVALLTALPPASGAAAGHATGLCAALGRLVRLHVFSATSGAACPAGAVALEPASALPFLSSGFDRVLGVLDGSSSDRGVARLLDRFGGGAIVLDGGRADRAAEPTLVHGAAAAVALHHGPHATALPFPVVPMDEASLRPAARAAARRRVGGEGAPILLASFGPVGPAHAAIDYVWTLDQLREWGYDAQLRFVGTPAHAMPEFDRLVTERGLSAHIRVCDGDWADHLAGADVAVQLWTGEGLAAAAELAACIGAGLPTVASATLAMALDAPGFVRRIPDRPSPVLAAEAVVALLEAPADTAERRGWAGAHGYDVYARRLCEALGLR